MPVTGRCMRCQKNDMEMTEAQEVPFGNRGGHAMKGKCAKCGTRMFKILPKNK